MSRKIKMRTPLVDIDGDEMAHIIWHLVKEKLLSPYIALKTDYYDLSLKQRDDTNDEITLRAAEAIKKYRVGVKCATITPNKSRVKQYSLKKQWKSPNNTIREVLDGTIFREPIVLKNIEPAVRFWKKPIIIGRHAYGDVYENVEYRIDDPIFASLLLKNHKNNGKTILIKKFEEAGVIQAIYNLDSSIKNFAKSCFKYALNRKIDLWFAAKDTISKVYDSNFKEIFNQIYEEEYKDKFTKKGINYFYTLIDDAISRVVRSEGGFLWACKNYDGDVMSDFLAAVYGSLATMTSVLISPNGYFLYEAAHGTVKKHYNKYLNGEETSTNSLAIIFAWADALGKKGEVDEIPKLIEFSKKLKEATKKTIEEDGIMTRDLVKISRSPPTKAANTEEFIDAVSKKLEMLMN
jgi:isocitrate dehydrogenase